MSPQHLGGELGYTSVTLHPTTNLLPEYNKKSYTVKANASVTCQLVAILLASYYKQIGDQ